MRLTQLAGSSLRLDLFVIADRGAKVDGLSAVYSDGYRRGDSEYVPPTQVHARRFGKRIALPSLVDLMGESCVVTWLQADLPNTRLGKDFYIQFADTPPTRHTVYTHNGAILTTIENALLAAAVVFLIGALLHAWRVRKAPRLRLSATLLGMTALIGVAGAAGGAAALLTYPRLPQAKTLSEIRLQRHGTSLKDAIEMLQHYPDILAQMSVTEVDQYIRDALEGSRNPYTGEPYAFEEAPGDMVIVEDEFGIVARVFVVRGYRHAIGEPVDVRITGENPDGDHLYDSLRGGLW